MKNKKNRCIPKICFFAGIGLISTALIAFAFWQIKINLSAKKSDYYAQAMRSLISDVQGAIPEERRDNTMPIISIDETDFVGIIEMPKYNSALPVCATWGNLTKYPCHFGGSIYDRTMQIGATTQKGQYDFYHNISVNDTVYFTDSEGNRFTYKVTNLRYEKHATQSELTKENSSLTLFIKNIYDFEYLIVFCDIAK